MKGVILEVLVASLLAVAESQVFTDLESGLHLTEPEKFKTLYFDNVWPSGVKSFMVPIHDTSDKPIGSGIFYKKDCFIMSAKCINENLKFRTDLYENPSSVYRHHTFQIAYVSKPPEGVAVAKTFNSLCSTKYSELLHPENLFFNKDIANGVLFYTLGWNDEKEVFIRKCILHYQDVFMFYMKCGATYVGELTRPGDPIFFMGKICGIFHERKSTGGIDAEFTYHFRKCTYQSIKDKYSPKEPKSEGSR